MLIRIVKMTFKEELVGEFLKLFEETKTKIKSSKGCSRLELLKDFNDSKVFFTYSHWDDESCLDDYRNSEVFREVWSKTKKLFADKPQAFSTKQFIVV